MVAVYDTRVQHVRRSPLQHAFSYRSRSWLVDLDHLPHKGFESRDHLGDPRRTLRENVDALLAGNGITCERVLLLTSPRRLGHVFNPLSVYWCLDATGTLVATVAEVHNTYGGRHTYVLRPGERVVDKAFHVSPFHDVAGHYELDLPLPDALVRLVVTYHRPDAEPFVATLRGTRRLSPGWRLSDLWSTRLVALRIRLQGIRLYRKGLPVMPRPLQHQEIS